MTENKLTIEMIEKIMDRDASVHQKFMKGLHNVKIVP